MTAPYVDVRKRNLGFIVGTKYDSHKTVKYKVFVVLDMNITVFLNMTLCSFVDRFSDLEELLLSHFQCRRASCTMRTEAAGSSETLKKNYIHIVSVSLWVCAAFHVYQHVKQQAVC